MLELLQHSMTLLNNKSTCAVSVLKQIYALATCLYIFFHFLCKKFNLYGSELIVLHAGYTLLLLIQLVSLNEEFETKSLHNLNFRQKTTWVRQDESVRVPKPTTSLIQEILLHNRWSRKEENQQKSINNK